MTTTKRWRELDARKALATWERSGETMAAFAWAEAGSRFTRDFEDLVAWLAREMNKTAVARVMRVAWATVSSITERVVARRLDEKRLDDLRSGATARP